MRQLNDRLQRRTSMHGSPPASGRRRRAGGLLLLACGLLLAGCGTTTWSNTDRRAAEQLLLSDSIDRTVARLDFSILAGMPVYLDTQYLDDSLPDAEYLVSSVRERLISAGCRLRNTEAEAEYVVELRSGGVGTDQHDNLFLGVPELVLPLGFAGTPSRIPEIPLIKETDQIAATKVGVFAYRRQTGEPVWKSGLVTQRSTLHRLWFFGAGPFERGRTAAVTPSLDPLEGLPDIIGSDDEGESFGANEPMQQEAIYAVPQDVPAAPPPEPAEPTERRPVPILPPSAADLQPRPR